MSEQTFRSAWRRILLQRSPFVGLVIVCTLLLTSVFADFLANARPVFGSAFGETQVLGNIAPSAQLAAHSKQEIDAACTQTTCVRSLVRFGPRDLDAKLLRPFQTSAHPLGTDSDGRDVFAIMVHGTRAVVTFALLAVVLLVSLGTALGAVSGFFGGLLDSAVARLVETMTAFPTLVFVLATQALVPHASSLTLLLAISLTRWAEVARVVRAEVLDVANEDYTLAARALGASPMRVLMRHVFPNARGQVIVAASFALSAVVLLEASCDFLGIGVSEDWPTWGHLMGQGRRHPEAWWLVAFPTLLLLALVAAQTAVSDALRHYLDPKARSSENG
jgi:peptide/nickel transport system permease protein